MAVRFSVMSMLKIQTLPQMLPKHVALVQSMVPEKFKIQFLTKTLPNFPEELLKDA
jgi:hypothetical protein